MSTKRPAHEIDRIVDRRMAGETLEEIGASLGISRERVRQIIKERRPGAIMSTFERTAMLVERAIEAAPLMGSVPLSSVSGRVSAGSIRKHGGKRRVQPTGGPPLRGYATEELVIKKLEGLGIPAKGMPYRAPYDIDCSGTRVEVKTGELTKTSPGLRGKQWRFPVRHQAKDRLADIFIFYIPDTQDFFIVPAAELRKRSTSDFYFVWPRGKYRAGEKSITRFHNRWDLIAKHPKLSSGVLGCSS